MAINMEEHKSDVQTTQHTNQQGNSYIWTKILANYSTPGYNAIKNEWLQLRNDNKQIILYGAGNRCIYLLNWCSAIGLPVDGIAVSLMNNNPEEINRVKVKPYPSYPKDASIIISIENKAEAKIIREMLHSQGYTSVYCVDSNMKLISTDE